jgi:UDP-2,3-diacylglucosamine pyrophosphatase LpxH
MKKFIFSPDKHVGFERKKGKLVPLHDEQAIGTLLSFAKDFKPDIWIEGGDNLDCGPVSHWLKDKHKSAEDLDLWEDCELYSKLVLEPISKLPSVSKRYWMLGNHEAWLDDVIEREPGLEAALAWPQLLPRLKQWNIVEQGNFVALGKNLRFVHGDTLRGGVNVANATAQTHKNSVRFGHFHSFQTATRYNPFDSLDINTAIMVPGLCNKNPNYLKSRANQWLKGFLYGYVQEDSTFHDSVALIINGKTIIGGKTYSA